MGYRSIILLLPHNLCHSLPLFFQPLPSFQIILPHLLQVLLEQNFPLLAIFGLLAFSKDLEDVFLKEIRIRVSDVDKFQGILNCDLASTSKIVHQKLNKIKEVSGLESGLIEDASFVHESELVLNDFSVQILINFPDPLIDLWFAVGKRQLGEHSNHVLLVNGQTNYLQSYGFLLKASLSPLRLLTFSPQILRKVLRSLSASMFSIGIS